MSEPQGFQCPSGVVCWTTHGIVQSATVQSINESRAFCERSGMQFDWREMPGGLVDKARNDAVEFLLRSPAGFLLFLDADMVWQPPAVAQLVQSAYAELPWADIVGAWCPLRNPPYLPTIDTGTGTWEPHEPLQGPMEVIRTGGAFVLVKRHVFERMEKPWYGVRPVPRPIDFIQELDGYARQKFDGRNPFVTMKEWGQLTTCAQQDTQGPRDPRAPFANVGEDSNFADKARALGFRIVVQTNIEIAHLEQRAITGQSHRDEMNKARATQRLLAGVMS